MKLKKQLVAVLFLLTLFPPLLTLPSVAISATFASLPKTGQTTSYATNDDGALQKGVAWPGTQFVDNGDGTVTDALTGLVWLKDANCFDAKVWSKALASASTLASGACGLTDGSTPGEWRLPGINELLSLGDSDDALPTGHPFSNVQFYAYWSSTTVSYMPSYALIGNIFGAAFMTDKGDYYYVWPVRGGQWLFDSLVVSGRLQIGTRTAASAPLSREVLIRNNDISAKSFSVSISGLNASEFSVAPGGVNSCGSLTPTLAAGTSCTMVVTTNLASAGEKTAGLSITTSAGTKTIPITATRQAVAGPPTATTRNAYAKTATGATLSGIVSANAASTTVSFEYGTTTSYGSTVTAEQSPLSAASGSEVFASINGLTPNKLYHYRIKAVNSFGTTYGLDSQFATGWPPNSTTPPPSNIEVLPPTTTGQLTITWSQPIDNINYLIYRSTVAGELGARVGSAYDGIKYTDTGLRSQTKYYYTVNSFDTSHQSPFESNPPPQVSGTTLDVTPPSAPGSIAATFTGPTPAITLTWANPADADFNHIHIYRSTVLGALGTLVHDNITTTSKIDTSLENLITYYYTIRAVDVSGNETTNTSQVSATVILADIIGPGAVSNAIITFPPNGDKTTLTWTNPGGDFDFILIYRSTTSGQRGELVYQGTAATFTDTTITPSSDYWYTIDAIDTSGNVSSYTAPSVRPLDTQAPACITQLKATPLPDAKIQLSWLRSPSTDVNIYYEIYEDNGSGTISATSTKSTTHPVTTWTSTTPALTDGVTYQYAIKVADGAGNTSAACATIAVTAHTNPAASGVSAAIKTPYSGKKYTGNQLQVVAEQAAGLPSDLKEIEFQYYNGTSWEKITPAAATLNPDSTPSYFIYWDVTGMANGDYKLRAVASNTNSVADSTPGFTTVTLNKDAPDIIQNGGSSQETVNTTSGGTVATSAASIIIPAGTFTADATVTITTPDPATKAATVPTNYDNAQSFHDITTTGTTTPDSTITVELPYPDNTPDDLKLDTAPAISVLDLKVCRNVSGQTWTCLDSTVDTTNKVVRANTTTLGLMALLVPPVTMTQSGYNMASVALTPSNSATSSVFGGYVLDYNPTTQAFFKPTTIQPGHGYFIWGARTLKPVGTEITAATHTVAIKKGWNVIGNPYKMKLPVQSLTLNCGTPKSITQSELDGEIVGTFFYAINGAYELATTQTVTDTIDPWKGYWLLSDKDCDLIFTKP